MAKRKILFLVTIWLVPVVILVGFIAAIRYVLLASQPIAVAEANANSRIAIVAQNEKPSPTPRPTASSENKMPTSTGQNNNSSSVKFYDALRTALAERKRKIEDLCDREDKIAQRILNDYGAVFLAKEPSLPPPVCMFTSSDAVLRFQQEAGIAAETIAGARVELQKTAMQALLAARRDAQSEGLDITPRDGAEAGRRSFEDTLRLWDSRFLPALVYWTGKGRITATEADELKKLPLKQQVAAVLNLEERGIYFSKDFSKSILYSVAAPGCSQHLSMLAFDANEFQNRRVRDILARHGWFRTVQNDLPHFTFLGLREDELARRGLKKLETRDGEFWIPNV